MKKNEVQILALKISQLLFFLVGIAFSVYNLFSFKVDKFGYYFSDGNQTWLAFGITLLAAGYFVRNWKKL